MAWNFEPGMPVVCIDASPTIGRYRRSWFGLRRRFVPEKSDLVEGEVYTVGEVIDGFDLETEERILCLAIVELPPLWDDPNGCYDARRFKPLSELRLEQFRVHLNPIVGDPLPADVCRVAAARHFGGALGVLPSRRVSSAPFLDDRGVRPAIVEVGVQVVSVAVAAARSRIRIAVRVLKEIKLPGFRLHAPFVAEETAPCPPRDFPPAPNLVPRAPA